MFPAACDAANAAVSRGHGSLSVIVHPSLPILSSLLPLSFCLFLSLHPFWCCTRSHALVISTFLLRRLPRTLWIQMVLFCIYLFHSPKGSTRPTQWKRWFDAIRATRNFLRGAVWILIRCVCRNTVPIKKHGLLENCTTLQSYQKAEMGVKKKKKKKWNLCSETHRRHHTSYEFNHTGFIMMQAGCVESLPEFSNHVFPLTRERCFTATPSKHHWTPVLPHYPHAAWILLSPTLNLHNCLVNCNYTADHSGSDGKHIC